MALHTRIGATLSAAVITLLLGVGSAAAAEPPIVATPAFKARDLVAVPRTNWVTNGGNTFNQRYSPLTLLNRDNVRRRSCTTRARCTW